MTNNVTLGLALLLAVGAGCGATHHSLPDDAAVQQDAAASDAGAADAAPLVWGACDTSNWYDGYPLPAAGVECTSIDVPLDHAQPDGATITLNVARHKSTAYPTGKAAFQLAGGPGGASVAQSGVIPSYMPNLRDTFDLIYVDQRGTGGSGYLDCPSGYPQTGSDWAACGTALATQPLQHYLTVDAAHDLNLVRQRLGYDKIYLRGGSYGTRLGLEYLRQHGDTVVAAVLDGLAPPDFDHFGELIRNVDTSIARLVADCAASAACTAVSPTLGADLVARRQALHASPRHILVGGQAYEEDEWLYIDALVSTVWDSYWRFKVPHAIHDAVSGDNTRWNALLSDLFGATVTDATSHLRAPARPAWTLRPLRPFVRGRSYVAPGLYLPVVCAEWLPNAPGGTPALHTLAAQQTWGDEDDDYAPPAMAEACTSWSVTAVDPALRQRVTSDVPTLLLSGDIDFNTTQAWGVDALGSLSHGTHLVVPFATHSTMSVPCVGDIITAFLEADGDITQVDQACLATITEPAWP